MNVQLNSLSKDDLLQVLASLESRISLLERFLQGEPIGTVRIADLAVTNAKILSLAVDKLTTGTLNVNTLFDIGDVDGGNYIEIDGGSTTLIMYKDDVDQLMMGAD